ncbi:MAG: 50S ribosomal protein L9 [Arcanobacterium sp.]|nr:50S ribosomal protein L9 [Arcanobacterium sp.]MDY5589874.1 50S ribosomal protein L9 [Arcanobacterium sp.]
MKIILTHEVKGLGAAGDVVTVKDGYGRNYLIPRGYAAAWTKGAQRQIDQIAEARRKRATDDLEAARELRDELEAATIVVTKKAGENGRFFGSITAADIAAAATELLGKAVDRRTITMDSTVKSAGNYTGSVKLHDDIVAAIKVQAKAA